MKQKGFTLIELLVVVAIIGILAAVGVVAYNGYTSSAKAGATKANFKMMQKYMSAEIAKGNNDKVIELSEKMSVNYDKLIDLFPDNSKAGYDTEALPTIWLQKDEFNALMIETSDKVKKFTQLAANLTGDELKEAQKNLIWSSCKACHDKFRMPH